MYQYLSKLVNQLQEKATTPGFSMDICIHDDNYQYRLEDHDVEKLCNALRCNTTINHLSIWRTALSNKCCIRLNAEGAYKIFQAVMCIPTLTALLIEARKARYDYIEDGHPFWSQNFPRIIYDNRKLKVLSIHSCNITDGGAELLARHPTIEILSLAKNIIADDGAIALAQNQRLRELDIQENQVGNRGAAAFANNQSIEILSLAKNAVKDDGAIGLAQNQRLRELDIQKNQVGNRGIAAFATNQSITKLNLSDNHEIGDAGILALSRNTRLTNIDYRGSVRSSQVLAAMLERNVVGDEPEEVARAKKALHEQKRELEQTKRALQEQQQCNAQRTQELEQFKSQFISEMQQLRVEQETERCLREEKTAFDQALQMVAKQYDAGAQANLGGMYHMGRGVERDLNEAIAWYSLAAAQGNETAKGKLNLDCFSKHGRRITACQAASNDDAEAKRLYEKAQQMTSDEQQERFLKEALRKINLALKVYSFYPPCRQLRDEIENAQVALDARKAQAKVETQEEKEAKKRVEQHARYNAHITQAKALLARGSRKGSYYGV